MNALVRPSSALVDDRFTALLGSWIAPATALVAVGLGLFLIIQPYPGTTNFLPFAMFAVGLAALSVCVSIRREGVRGESPPARPPASAPPGAGSPPRAPRVISPARRRLSDSIARGSGSEWRVLSDPTSPGDETWLGWLPRERRRLGSEENTLASNVVRSPGRAGNLVAFPVRDYYGTVPPNRGFLPHSAPWAAAGKDAASRHRDRGSVTPPVALGPIGEWPSGSGRTSPYSVEELDRMFPPVSEERPLFLSQAPQKVGRAGRPWAQDALEPPSRSPEGLEDARSASDAPAERSESTAVDDVVLGGDRALNPRLLELSLEAANPVPPHLRATGPIDRSENGTAGRGRHVPSPPRSVCASCSKVVMNLRMSGPCPKCLRPVCDECLRESIVARGRGWCLDCSTVAATAS